MTTEPAPDATFRKVPVTIVTGFLGAGKTTLIRDVLQQAKGRKLALIINEFGDEGVDGEILRSCGIESCSEENIVELANGCLCCTVADDFIPAIEALLSHERRPEHIIVETSGLALPKPLVKAFDWPSIRARLTVDGVVAVVDGPAVAAGRFADDPEALLAQREDDQAVDHDNPLEEVYEDQLLCADLIVLNKSDLLDAGARSEVAASIAGKVGRAVKVVETEEGRIDIAVLLGLGAAAEDDLANRPSHHDAEEGHDHDDFDSFVVERGPVSDPAGFRAHLTGLIRAHDVLRVKGFLDVPGRDRRQVVQAVGDRIEQHFDRSWLPGERRASRLVVIGRKGLDRAAIMAALEAM
jgi:cobalamin biosynthesis protein CobW